MIRGGRRVAAFGLCVAGVLGGVGVFGAGCAVGDGGDTGTVVTHDSGGVDTNVVDSGALDTTVPGDTPKPDTSVDDTGSTADTKDSGTDATVVDTAPDTKDSGTDAGPDTRDVGTDAADTADAAVPDTADAIGPSDALSTCINKGFTGALVTYDLTGKTGSEVSDTATKVALGLTAGSLTRAGTLTATAGADSMNSSGWGTTAAVDKTKYLSFTVTPSSGCVISLSSLFVDVKSSGTGPSNGSVGTSADSFASLGTFGANATFTVTIGGVTLASGATEIRVYGYGASSAAGTMRVQNTMTLNGKID